MPTLPKRRGGNECWDAVIDLARSRGAKLLIVVLECSLDENARRIQGLDREAKRKPRDPAIFRGNAEGRPLLDRGGDHLLRLDVTELGSGRVRFENRGVGAVSLW